MYKIDSFKGQVYYGSRLRFLWSVSDISGLRHAITRVLTEVPDLEFRERRTQAETYETKRRAQSEPGLIKVLTMGRDDIILVVADDIECEAWDRLHQVVHGILVAELDLAPVDIRSYEIRCVVEFLSRHNFYEVLMRTLFQGSLLEELMEGKLLYQFDPLFRFAWPTNSQVKYSLDFTSNQEYSDFRGRLPQPEGRLLITFTREMDEEDFATAGSVADQIAESRRQFLQALDEFLVPKIIDPMRDALSSNF